MPVAINFKICDNAQECNGIAVCPTGALSWDEKNKKIKIDNTKCTSCGLCESACEVDAIRVAKTAKEFEKIQKEIEEDPRKISDLFVDRYGAQPLEPAFLISEDKFDLEVLGANKITIAEFFNNDSIQCLRLSIPISKLLEGKDVKYRRVELTTDALLKKYNVQQLPSLLFFKNGELIGKIEGHYETKDEDKLKEKIDSIL